MLWWLRVRARLVAPVVLLALGILALPHGGGVHDRDDSLPTVVIHDASDHSISAAPSSSGERPDHCAICHWTRAFRQQTRVAGLAASATTEHVVRLPREESTPANSGVATRPPLRAPPSSPNFA